MQLSTELVGARRNGNVVNAIVAGAVTVIARGLCRGGRALRRRTGDAGGGREAGVGRDLIREATPPPPARLRRRQRDRPGLPQA